MAGEDRLKLFKVSWRFLRISLSERCLEDLNYEGLNMHVCEVKIRLGYGTISR